MRTIAASKYREINVTGKYIPEQYPSFTGDPETPEQFIISQILFQGRDITRLVNHQIVESLTLKTIFDERIENAISVLD